MEFNRNHYFLTGIVILLFGIQLRMVDSYVLNESSSRFLATRFGAQANNSTIESRGLFPSVGPVPRRTLRPPEWLGWALLSVGSVLAMHALAMRAPQVSG